MATAPTLAPLTTPGRGGLPRVVATHAATGAALEVYLHGAHVTSFSHAGAELLYVSAAAAFDGARPIRGGIPVAFPQFAAQGPLPMHGFARTRPWALASVGDGRVVLELRDDAETRALWPHAFAATYALDFAGPRLAATLSVRNVGAAPFAFEALLHAYLELGAGALAPGAAPVRVEGTEGRAYADKPSGGARLEQPRAPLALAGEVDRVYGAPAGAPARGVVTVRGAARATRVTFGARGARGAAAPADVVVWNPGAARAAGIADLEAGGWERFVCVEPGVVADATRPTLAPGEEFALDVEYEMM